MLQVLEVCSVLIKRSYQRSFDIEIGRKVFTTPFFFPAISSVKTNFSMGEYLSLIQKIGYPSFLVSSYDIYHSDKDKKVEILKIVSEATEGDFLSLLDSGHYEAFWYSDNIWSFEMLESILNEISIDFCFSYDIFWDEKKKKKEHLKETITSIAKTAGAQKSGTTIPLLHSKPDYFPSFAQKIVEGINPEIIAIPERELGAGIFERATTVKNIRKSLDDTNRQIPLHLLGTGNPISILIYSICGADLYDGLEWCQTVVNPETGHLFHFTQKDLLECSCKACKLKEIPYPMQTMVHNLLFYEEFIKTIRYSIQKGKEAQLLDKYLKPKSSKKIKEIAGLK